MSKTMQVTIDGQQLEMFVSSVTLEGYKECTLLTPMVRNTDPDTSHKAAKSARVRVGSQQWQLLAAYGQAVDMTADEAGVATGLANKPGCCYWHRVSDLLKFGYLEPTGEQRVARSGELQRVNRITETGRARLASRGV
jgi:hypothetical protein